MSSSQARAAAHESTRVTETLRSALWNHRSVSIQVVSTVDVAPDTRIWISDGVVVGVVASPCAEEGLGRVMVDAGLLSAEGYASALDRLAEAPSTERLGDVLQKWQLATPERIELGLARQAELRILRAMADEAASVVVDDTRRPNDVAAVRIALEQLTYGFATRLSDAGLEAYMATARDLYPVVTPSNAATYVQKSGATTSWLAFLARLDGTTTCDDICCGDGERERFLVGLMIAGLLDLHEQAQVASQESAFTEDEISGLRPAATLEEDLARSSVDELQALASGDGQNDVGKNAVARVKLNRVTLSLRKVPARSARDPRDARLLAELHYLNAQTLARIGSWDRAMGSIKSALVHLPSDPSYALAAARFRWKGNAQEREALLAQLEAFAYAPWHPLANLVRAELEAERGEWDSAYEQTRCVLRWNPRSQEAKQRLTVLEKRRSAPAIWQTRSAPSLVSGTVPATQSVRPSTQGDKQHILQDRSWIWWVLALALGLALGVFAARG